jgi:hypothetical protein
VNFIFFIVFCIFHFFNKVSFLIIFFCSVLFSQIEVLICGSSFWSIYVITE